MVYVAALPIISQQKAFFVTPTIWPPSTIRLRFPTRTSILRCTSLIDGDKTGILGNFWSSFDQVGIRQQIADHIRVASDALRLLPSMRQRNLRQLLDASVHPQSLPHRIPTILLVLPLRLCPYLPLRPLPSIRIRYTPRQAAHVIRAMYTLTGDRGSDRQTFDTGSLDYNVTGLPGGALHTGGQHALFHNSSGTSFLYVWRAQQYLGGGQESVCYTSFFRVPSSFCRISEKWRRQRRRNIG